ncbi:MAG: hypothetical protein U1F37_13945 [Alphaproteobacteria bacterium]
MLTWNDCVAFYNPTDEEIRALAARGRASPVGAGELGAYLVYAADGAPGLSRRIVGDIAAAQGKGDRLAALQLKAVLRHFIERHRPAPLPAACCCCC